MWEEFTRPLASLNATDLAVLLGATLLAGLVRGFSGFGSAMILVPSYSLVFSPAVTIPIMSLVDVAGTTVVQKWLLRQSLCPRMSADIAQTSELQPRSHAEAPGWTDFHDSRPAESARKARRSGSIGFVERVLDEGFEREAFGAQANTKVE